MKIRKSRRGNWVLTQEQAEYFRQHLNSLMIREERLIADGHTEKAQRISRAFCRLQTWYFGLNVWVKP